MGEAIKVICRFRPQNKIEKERNAFEVIDLSDDGTMAAINHPDKEKHPTPMKFSFDRVFGSNSAQAEVFEYAAKHLVDQIFEGFNATIFAYGQTGAGKTYSMEGQLGSPHRGIVPRTVEHIFDKIADADQNNEFVLKIAYVEIYLESLRDLLNPRNNSMKIRESNYGVYIEGVTEMYVRDPQEVIDLMTMGAGNRTVSSTGMNEVSSRSHGVFMLKLEMKSTQTGTKKMAKLMMVDLAGSEKVAKTGATGQLLEEAKKINQSLSALGNVMNALSSGKGHVAYRDSVLTRLLSDSLGGNCKTTLLIACSPSSYNVDETIGTLRFGTRAKKIKNKAKINVDKTVAEYKKDIAVLTKELEEIKKKFQGSVKTIAKLKAQVKAATDAGFVVPDMPDEKDEEQEEEAEPKTEEDQGDIETKDPLEPTINDDAAPEQENATKKEVNDIDKTPERLPRNSTRIAWEATKEAELQQSRERVADAEQRIAELEAQIATQTKNNSMEVPLKEIHYQVPQAVSDLSPELLQKAREGLHMENKMYREQIERLNQEMEKQRESSHIKDERLNKALQKADELEMECDKLMSQQEMLEENIDGLTREKRSLEQERDEMEKQMELTKQSWEETKKRLEQIQKETEERIQAIRAEESKKANDFITEARQQIQASQQNNARTRESKNLSTHMNAVGKLRDKYVQDAKAQQRTAQLQELKMKEFEQEMIEQMNEIRFEYMRVKTELQNQSDDYTRTRQKMSEREIEIQNLQEALSIKEEKIRQQNNDLQEFGKMKKATDKIHNEKLQKAQNTIRKLKLQLKNIQRTNETNAKKALSPTNSNSSNWQQFGYPDPKSDLSSLIEMKRKQTVVVPLRGGGGKHRTSGIITNGKQEVNGTAKSGYEYKKTPISNSMINSKPDNDSEDFFDDVIDRSKTTITHETEDPPFMKQVSRHGRRDSAHLLNRVSSDKVW